MPNPLGGWAAGGTRLSLDDYRADFRATESIITEQDSWKLERYDFGSVLGERVLKPGWVAS